MMSKQIEQNKELQEQLEKDTKKAREELQQKRDVSAVCCQGFIM